METGSSLCGLFLGRDNDSTSAHGTVLHASLAADLRVVSRGAFRGGNVPIAGCFGMGGSKALPPSGRTCMSFPLFHLNRVCLACTRTILENNRNNSETATLHCIGSLHGETCDSGALTPVSSSSLALGFVVSRQNHRFFFRKRHHASLMHFKLFAATNCM